MGGTLSLADAKERSFIDAPPRRDEHSSGVSWSAVIGGAFVAAAISLVMLALGAGFGLMAVSPWSGAGMSAAAAGWAAILWLVLNEAISCSLGGYLAGRLRTKWVAVHTDEVYFRDTANGFLVWAVAVVITAAYLVSSAAAMVGKPAPASGETKASVDPRAYFVDRLFRSDSPGSQSRDASLQAEATRILTVVLERPDSSSQDVSYLSKLVAAKTGVSEVDADKRVSEVVTEARRTEDTARQSASHLLLWTFVALLTGAFCASYAATIGGRQRDHVKAV
jgi:hypothetical protein